MRSLCRYKGIITSMINENTLKILNSIGFGADIDSLESYIIDYKQARLLSNLAFYSENYNKLYKILEEVKPNSIALTDKLSLSPLEIEKYDKIFDKYNNIHEEVIYGTKGINMNTIKSNIDTEEDESIDIIALANVSGIDINILYINGYIYRVYAIGETNKYIDLTEILKQNEKVIGYIDELSDYELVELRGKLTIFNNNERLQKKSLNIPCSVMRCIRTKTNISNLNIVLNDIIIDTDDENDVDLPFNNQWDKIEYMRDLNLSVPHHVLIRNVDRDNIEEALIEIDKYLENEKNTNGIVYKYSGVVIRFNNDIICSAVGHKFIYNSEDSEPNKVFYSTAKSISTTNENNGLGQRLNIIKTQCNDKLFISSIDIEDLYDLEDFNIQLGKRICFKTIENKAVLCKE